MTASSVGAVYREIDPALIVPNPRQPRQVFDEEALAELVHSIREFGLMQPIVVRAPDPAGRYQLVMGERRWRAAQRPDWRRFRRSSARPRDDDMLRDALLENIHRVQLNPLEEAAAYQQLLEEFGVTHDELAARIGRSRPLVTNMIRLLRVADRRAASSRRGRAVGRPCPRAARPGGGPRCAGRTGRANRRRGAVGARHRGGRHVGQPRRQHAARRVPRRKPIQMPGLQDIAERLSSNFDTRVTVSLGKRKGKIVVEFGSVDDLQRIVSLMNAADWLIFASQ